VFGVALVCSGASPLVALVGPCLAWCWGFAGGFRWCPCALLCHSCGNAFSGFCTGAWIVLSRARPWWRSAPRACGRCDALLVGASVFVMDSLLPRGSFGRSRRGERRVVRYSSMACGAVWFFPSALCNEPPRLHGLRAFGESLVLARAGYVGHPNSTASGILLCPPITGNSWRAAGAWGRGTTSFLVRARVCWVPRVLHSRGRPLGLSTWRPPGRFALPARPRSSEAGHRFTRFVWGWGGARAFFIPPRSFGDRSAFLPVQSLQKQGRG